VKVQNGGWIQDGVENVYIFHRIFSKMIFLSIFLLFLFILDKNKIFMEKLFSSKFKMAEKFNMKDDIFQQKNQDFIIAQPLNEMFLYFDML
jgi:hypothetical protein